MSLLDIFLRRPQPVAELSERRRHPRYAIMQPVEVRIANRTFNGSLTDLSLGGARLTTRYSRDPGDVVGLSLTVEEVTSMLPLRVMWTRMEQGEFSMGGAFVDLTQQEAEHLQRYLDVYAAGKGALTQRLHIA